MSTKKWLLLIVLGMAVCVTMVAIVCVGWFFGWGSLGVEGRLPLYKTEQTASAHPGYLRTTVTSGRMVFVCDYDEYPLQLQDLEPKNGIGRQPVGGASVFAIPGQKVTDYIAVDEGSEMPAYAIFRNIQLPPFDWRHAKFQSMVYTGPIGRGARPQVTDPALIEDVVSALRNGNPLPSLALSTGSVSNLYALWLYTDQLPGLVYGPKVYADPAGSVYLSESVAMVSTNPKQWAEARWVPAGPLFTKWLQTP